MGQCEHTGAFRPLLPCQTPDLLGDKGHKGLQQTAGFINHIGNGGLRFRFGRTILAQENRLGQFKIPIAHDIPDEAIGRIRRIIETIGLNRMGDLMRGPCQLTHRPAVQCEFHLMGIKSIHPLAAIHARKARGIPKLGGKIPVAFDALRRQLNIATLRGHGR